MNSALFWLLAFAFFLFATVQLLLIVGKATNNHALQYLSLIHI